MQYQNRFTQTNILAIQEHQGIHCKRGSILSISKVSRVCMYDHIKIEKTSHDWAINLN